MESEPFKYQGRADIEGAHTKYFFTDSKGDKWLFKPAEDFRAYGDEAAYRIGRLIDPDAIEVRYIDLDIPGQGKLKGSIQKWRTDLKKEFDFRDAVVEKLTAAELEQLQREHVIDWLISNHDAHGKQFLRLKNGHIRGLDKSQLFKYLGDDKLSITYHPNHGWGEKEPFYNAVMRAWREGTIDLDLQATYRYVRRVETITDDAYTELLKPYAERRFRKQPLKLKQFYETALTRKNNLRYDFEEFYTGLLRQRTGERKAVFHFDLDVKELPADKAARKWKHIPEDAEVMIEDARESGWQGKSLPVDIDDIEDQNVLLYTEQVKGKTRTVMRMKIRPDAEKKLLAHLSTGPGDTFGQAAGQALADDL
ncbi:phage head morphogenesis protein, partial [bacterium]|nr:phage head morphogenesis protein [bacterium]